MMLADKEIMHDFGIQHCEDEGSWMLCDADKSRVGEDDE